jgi:hypothetical protein
MKLGVKQMEPLLRRRWSLYVAPTRYQIMILFGREWNFYPCLDALNVNEIELFSM